MWIKKGNGGGTEEDTEDKEKGEGGRVERGGRERGKEQRGRGVEKEGKQ